VKGVRAAALRVAGGEVVAVLVVVAVVVVMMMVVLMLPMMALVLAFVLACVLVLLLRLFVVVAVFAGTHRGHFDFTVRVEAARQRGVVPELQ
jgi:uncharacterized membrane protein